jgi:hypothetical protein
MTERVMPVPTGRIVLAEHRVDPIIELKAGQPTLTGFFVRAQGEELPFELLPGNTVTEADFDAFVDEPTPVQLSGWDTVIDARLLRPSQTGAFSHTFAMPAAEHGRLPVSFFWTIEGDASTAGQRVTLGTLSRAQPYAIASAAGAGRRVELTDEPTAFTLADRTQCGFSFLGSNGLYTMALTLGAVSGTPPVLHASFVPQATTLTLESKGAFSLTAITDIFQQRSAFNSLPSGDHRDGQLAFIFDGKLPVDYCMRLMCAPSSIMDVLLGTTPRHRPLYNNFRNSLIDVANQSWKIEPAHAERFARRAIVVFTGNVTAGICVAMFRGHLRQARVVAVITTQRKLISELAADTALERQPPLDGYTVFVEGERELVVLPTQAYRLQDDHAERFLIALIAREAARSGRQGPADRDEMLAMRLPALPISKDNDLDAIALLLLANAHRGRVPLETSRLIRQIFDDDSLWLFPLRGDRTDRDVLLHQLAGRITAEYIATRAACELDGEVFQQARPAPADRLVEQADVDALLGQETPLLLRAIFARWQRGMDAWSAPRTMARIQAELQRRGLGKERFLRELAHAAYDILMGEATPDARRRSHLNPLVIAALPITEGNYDAVFHKEVAGLAAFAARRSAMKPGGIAILGVRDMLAKPIREIQTAVRMLFQQDITPGLADEIARYRLLLGETCRVGFSKLAGPMLDTLNADRVVVFSDLPFELVPYGNSILGLEYAISSYPATMSAYHLMMTADDAHQRAQEMQDRRAAVLCAPPGGSDPVIAWANHIASSLDPLADLLGLDAIYPVPGAETAASVLSAAADSSLVLFAGHGFASDQQAGLDVGAFTLSYQDILAQSWNGSVVLLFACESGAGDTRQGDLASAFLMRGARGVIATTAQIRLDVANQFLGRLMQMMMAHREIPLDYTFHLLRRQVALYELFSDPASTDLPMTLDHAQQMSLDVEQDGFSQVLRQCGIGLRDLLRRTPYTLSFKLYGGLAERIG